VEADNGKSRIVQWSLDRLQNRTVEGQPLHSHKSEKRFEYDCATEIRLTDDSEFMIFRIKPEYEYVRTLKLKKTKKNDMSRGLLCIF